MQREAATDTLRKLQREGSDGKVCAEEEVSFPTAPLSFSGFPSLDAAAAAALSAFSPGPYSSISGPGLGQTVKWTESDGTAAPNPNLVIMDKLSLC